MSVWIPVVIGAAFVWLVYRVGQWNERQSVIRGVECELKMHERSVGTAYSEKDRGSWDPDYMVFKLATVAVDNAIARGPGLFLNRDLTVILVSYRQVVGNLNQIIDKATDFQVIAELWRDPPPADQVKAAKQLVDSVHNTGIGNETLQQKPAAYVFFKIVTEQLRIENESRALGYFWAVTALNPGFLKSWLAWLAQILQSARRRVVSGWRRLANVASQSQSTPSLAPRNEQPNASTAHESHSFATVAPFDVTNITSANTSSTPISSTSSWKEHARLPLAERQNPSEGAPQRATRRRKAK